MEDDNSCLFRAIGKVYMEGERGKGEGSVFGACAKEIICGLCGHCLLIVQYTIVFFRVNYSNKKNYFFSFRYFVCLCH